MDDAAFVQLEADRLCDRLVLAAYTDLAVYYWEERGQSPGDISGKKGMCIIYYAVINTLTVDLAISQSVSVLAFDATVVSLTVYSTWKSSTSLRGMYLAAGGYETSLSVLFLRQGVFRFIVVFCWVLEIAIGDRVYRRSLAGLDIIPERS
ncbi:hypothetical protein Clacol_006001 [Clathrus columnatus]|uniref:Uncharacterized protein n=1 Tax=Clathrus columnatus TaxID=1419009 RepID=A0AAV5AE27_9AGAM|nr:hypothetical protein Clacol_006001 [Clathrus columnatus]